MLMCSKEGCPNPVQTTQLCAEDGHIAHERKLKTKSTEIDTIINDLQKLKEDLDSRVTKLNTWVKSYSGLLDLLERTTGVDTMTRDIENLKVLEQNIIGYYESEMESLLNGDDVLKLKSSHCTLDSFLH